MPNNESVIITFNWNLVHPYLILSITIGHRNNTYNQKLQKQLYLILFGTKIILIAKCLFIVERKPQSLTRGHVPSCAKQIYNIYTIINCFIPYIG